MEEVDLKWQALNHFCLNNICTLFWYTNLFHYLVWCILNIGKLLFQGQSRSTHKNIRWIVLNISQNAMIYRIGAKTNAVTVVNTWNNRKAFYKCKAFSHIGRMIHCVQSQQLLAHKWCICRVDSQGWTLPLLCCWVSGAYVHWARWLCLFYWLICSVHWLCSP